MEELLEAHAVRSVGFEGCAHARPGGKRQLLIIDGETLRSMDLLPGTVRENITTEGLAVNKLSVGQKLRVGQAELEVTCPCTPCHQLEKVRRGLRREIWGRRGMLCRVLAGGAIRPGDCIEKLL
ncbi:MAG: MOSC domain-containing protein [Proteobacteria bacterium]|nr:MAG: MOSC domain-containing protein [Pseudomonadota bacterium]